MRHVLLTTLLLVPIGACSAAASVGAPPPTTTPGALVPCADVVVAGDSIANAWPYYLPAAGYTTPVARIAVGGAGFTRAETALNIGAQVTAYLDRCPKPRLLIVHGGTNDLATSQPVGPLENAMISLDEELLRRDVTTMWLPITPWTGTSDARYANRLAINAWLASAPFERAGITGTNCNPALGNTDVLGHPTRHPTAAGNGSASRPDPLRLGSECGAEGNRTLDLFHAMEALSQLSYGPVRRPC